MCVINDYDVVDAIIAVRDRISMDTSSRLNSVVYLVTTLVGVVVEAEVEVVGGTGGVVETAIVTSEVGEGEVARLENVGDRPAVTEEEITTATETNSADTTVLRHLVVDHLVEAVGTFFHPTATVTTLLLTILTRDRMDHLHLEDLVDLDTAPLLPVGHLDPVLLAVVF